MPEKTENLDRTLDELRYIVGLTDNDIENFKRNVAAERVIHRFY